MFCHVSRTLKGVIFRSIQTIRDAVARTKTSTGLKVKAAIADKVYPKGIKATELFLLVLLSKAVFIYVSYYGNSTSGV